ncbi:MAG: winged helix DNA-binding protein [Chloroflexi bacterium]|nr:winged helix DNA-binding protein [Chloroflexota bacterium]
MSPRKRKKQPDALDWLILQVIAKWLKHKGYPPTVREIQQEANASSTSVVDYHLRWLENHGYLERNTDGDGKRKARNIRLTQKGIAALRSHDVLDVDATPDDELQALGQLARVRRSQRLEEVLRVAREEAVKARQSFNRLVSIPVAGRIVASQPIPTFPEGYTAEENIDVPESLLPATTKPLYALEVQGDSMIDALIGDGDIVILEETQEAANGDLVAVWLKDSNASTLKQFYAEYQNGQIKKVLLKPKHPTMKAIEIDDPSQVEIKGKVVLVIRKPGQGAHKPKTD